MPNVPLSAAVAQLGRAFLTPEPDATDGQLLTRFVRSRDEAAFAELVRRLGPMVLGVCRRVTSDTHLAEDAFQAAFLVLARRATDVHPREAVRGWLYGVAARTAQKARVMSARRRTREAPTPTLPDSPVSARDEPDPDVLRTLDEEVATLPDHLRAAVVLCELDGLSRKDVAVRLGIPEGTLSSRLAKARQILADRLRKRGIALGTAGLGWALGQLASAAVPLRLASTTTALVDGAVPIPQMVAALSQGVLRTMFLFRLKTVAVSAFLLGIACIAARAMLPEASAQEPAKPQVALARQEKPADNKKPQPAAKAAGQGTLLLVREGGLIAMTPDGKEGDELTPPKDSGSAGKARLSPDGTRAAFIINTSTKPRVPGGNDDPWPLQVVIQKLGEDKPSRTIDFPSYDPPIACWSLDGKKLAVSTMTARDPDVVFENVLLDVDTGKSEPLALPDHTRVLDWSRDGKKFLVQQCDLKAKKSQLGIAAMGDKEVTVLCDLRDHPWFRAAGRLSPDGKRVLFLDADPEDNDARKWGRSNKPYLLDIATKKRELLAEFPENAQANGVAWSPDGKKVAYTWVQLHPDRLKKNVLRAEDESIETEAFLIVADADGKNAKTISSAKKPFANMIFGTIDWR
jgi:RNA polymerase sigma factor (sigma-70 family)